MIKPEFIGAVIFSKKISENVTIVDDPALYGFYKELGFDIFEQAEPEDKALKKKKK